MDKLIPRISIEPASANEGESTEGNILDFKLEFNNKIFLFSLLELENKKLKLTAKKEDDQLNKYEAILELKKLRTEHKYFKMFDDFEEFQKNFIELCNSKSIKISYCDLEKMELKIDLKLISNNLFTIIMNKKEMNQKDLMKFLLQDNIEKEKIINNLTAKIQELEKNLNLKNNKIESLEKDIRDLKKKDFEKEKEIKEIKQYLHDSKNNIIQKKNGPEIKTTKNVKKTDKEKMDDILDELDDKFFIYSWLDTDDLGVLKKKIIEYKFNEKEIQSWLESKM